MSLRSSLIIKRSTNLLSTEFRRELKHDVACFTRDCTVPTTISVDIYENLWSELVIFTYTLIPVTAVAPFFHRGGVLLSPRWRFPSTAVTGLFVGFVWRKDSCGESRIATVKATVWRGKSRCDGERSEASVKVPSARLKSHCDGEEQPLAVR